MTNEFMNGNIWPVGGFYTKIFVGTPPQIQYVQIDTGSADLLIAQVGCKKCPQKVLYHPEASSTSKNVSCSTSQFHCRTCVDNDRCGFNNTYETCDYNDPSAFCSLLGVTYYDTFGVKTPIATVGFGGITQHAGAPDTEWTNMPGVLGMGYPALAGVWLNNTPFDSLVKAGHFEDVFALCLSTGTGGILTWGGADKSLYSGDIHYTPVILEMWYVIEMLDLNVDGKSVGLPSSFYNKIGNGKVAGTIIDSGTNTLVVGQAAYDILFLYFLEKCNSTNLKGICNLLPQDTLFSGKCFHLNKEELGQFPSVGFELRGIPAGSLKIPPAEYLKPHPEKDNKYCLEIQSAGVGGFTILGNVAQAPFYIIFDRHNARLGFAQKTSLCNE
eukprot:TRINITY_DN19762_c0_g1_i1.p1 TRINITY_DN19762_c0_g1~~TRINITY_DN19762_c0_g1_i1.p1  ORF type:complete len:384 (-),score=40.73 TRINITY_DN19762_c0_g1_i1:45-1196(-)